MTVTHPKQVLLVAALGLFAVACLPPDPAPDSATTAGVNGYLGNNPGADGGTHKGSTPLIGLGHGNILPSALSSTDPTFFASDGSGQGPQASALYYLNQRVTLALPTVSNITPCPIVSAGGCGGFNAVDPVTSDTVVVDTSTFASSLHCTIPTNNANYGSISGVWIQNPGGSYVIAVTSCGDLSLGAPYVGTNTPGASLSITNMNMGFNAGLSATAQGIVTGVWSAGSSFGFYMQDPASVGDLAGIFISKPLSSTSGASPPAVGDLVQVTGMANGATGSGPGTSISL
jgi:hypothetical protein